MAKMLYVGLDESVLVDWSIWLERESTLYDIMAPRTLFYQGILGGAIVRSKYGVTGPYQVAGASRQFLCLVA